MTPATPVSPSIARVTAVVALALALLAGMTLQTPPATARAASELALPASLETRSPVELAVQVTSGGEMVRGLGVDDFRLRVDGDKVPLTAVAEVRDGRLRTADGQPGEPVARHYLVFIDELFAMPAQRNHALDGLAAELPRLGAADRMAIVAFDGERLELLSGWTRSLPQLRAALEAARARPSHGLERLAEQRQEEASQRLSAPSSVLPPGLSSLGLESGRPPASETRMSLRRMQQIGEQISSLATAAAAAAAVLPPADDGRRVLVLLSGAWQVAAGVWPAGHENALAGATPLVRPLIETADRHGYSLYPVLIPAWATKTRRDRPVEGSHRAQIEVLRRLATETCGLALIDGRSSRVLERIADDSASYYRLRFVPEWRRDDHRRRVEVELAGRGARVRARPGLADLSRQTQIARLVAGARLIGLPAPGADAFEVDVVPGRGGDVAITLHIRSDAVIGARELELRVADPESEPGGDAPVEILRLGGERSASTAITHRTRVALPSRPHSLLVSLYDADGDALLVRQITVD